MAKDVTMRDIAKELGISTVSVSKALTDKEGVSSEMRAVIKEKAEKMGYRYSATKSGKDGKSYNIGVLVEEQFIEIHTSAFYFKMYQSIVIQLSKGGYSAMLEVLTGDVLQSGALPAILSENKVDGVITLGKIKEEYLEKIRETQIPLVYLDYYDDHLEIPSVTTDNLYGSYLLTDYLAQQGHERIAFVGGIMATPSIMDRYLGYMKALLSHNLTPEADYIINDRSEGGKYIDLRLPAHMPTAFVCNCDDIAYVLMEQLKSKGYRIPEDISVVGFDNSTFAIYANPKITTIEVDLDSMTEEACSILIRMIKGEMDIKGRRIVSGKLIMRDSVATAQQNSELEADSRLIG